MSSREDIVRASVDTAGDLAIIFLRKDEPLGLSWKHRKTDGAAVVNRIKEGKLTRRWRRLGSAD